MITRAEPLGRGARTWCCCLALLAGTATAQTNTPASYTVTSTMLGVDGVATAMHDGSMTVVEFPARPERQEGGNAWPAEPAQRQWNDLSTGRRYTVNVLPGVPNCSASDFSGDLLGDPFGMQGFRINLKSRDAKSLGPATVHGIATMAYEARTPGGSLKLWIEPSSGLPIKLVGPMFGQEAGTLLEVHHLSLEKPPAHRMALPPACQRLVRQPAPATASAVLDVGHEVALARIAALTGDSRPDAYLPAGLAPASAESCDVHISAVAAGTLKPLKAGVALRVQADAQGQPVPQRQQGQALILPQAPGQFDVDVSIRRGQSTSGTSHTIYRQCFGQATSRLLYVVPPEGSGSGDADFAWATPLAARRPVQPVSAVAVHMVWAGDEELRQRPRAPGEPIHWQRLGPGRLSTALETGRQEDQIVLTDLVSQETLTLKLQAKRLVFEKGSFGGSKAITRTQDVVDGFNAASVSTAEGVFTLTAPGRWRAAGNDPRVWTEQRRDGWSVFLREAASGETWQLDLYQQTAIHRSPGSSGPDRSAPITGAQVESTGS